MCVVGEATVRLGVEGVRRLARRVERLREEYPEYLRPRLIVVIYTSLATREAVREAGERGLTWSQLRRRTRWSMGTWREVLKYLWDTNQIVAVIRRGRGSRNIAFYAKAYEAHAIQAGDKIYDWSVLAIKLGLRE